MDPPVFIGFAMHLLPRIPRFGPGSPLDPPPDPPVDPPLLIPPAHATKSKVCTRFGTSVRQPLRPKPQKVAGFRKGKERKGKERKGKERKGKERKGKEREGKERK